MTRRILKVPGGLYLVSQSENTLLDPEGSVIQHELLDLVSAAISLKLAGNRVVVAVVEAADARGNVPRDQVFRAGYAAMVVSQTRLMSEWKQCLDRRGVLAAQVLVDAVVFYNKDSARQLAGVLTELTGNGVVPVVGLSAAGRGVGGLSLDAFLRDLLETHPRGGLPQCSGSSPFARVE